MTRTVDAYNPATNTWTPKAPLPSGRRQASGAAVISGKIYVAGGENGTNRLTTLEVYDPVGNSWAPKANMPTARAYSAAGAVNGLLYAVGGSTGFGVVSTHQ